MEGEGKIGAWEESGAGSLLVAFCLFVGGGCAVLPTSMQPTGPRGVRVIVDGWRFVRREVGGGGQAVILDDSGWSRVT